MREDKDENMNQYQVKDLLKSYGRIKARCRQLQARLRELEGDMCSLKATRYGVVHTTAKSEVVEIVFDRIEKIKQELLDATQKKYEIEQTAIELINKLGNKDNDIDVMYAYFIEGLKADKIARKYGYECEQVIYNKIYRNCRKLAILSKI